MAVWGSEFYDAVEYYNDLWRYNISSNEWTWMKGDSLEQSPCFNDLWRYVRDSTCGVYTEVNEVVESEHPIEIYPNPVSDVLHVKYSSAEKATLTIFNHLGNIVMRRNFENTNDVDVSFLTQGIYFVSISTAANCYAQKLVILR